MIRKIYYKVRSILINPYKGLLSFSEYKRIRDMKRFEHGETNLFGSTIRFSDNYGFLCSLLEIFKDEQNKFTSTNPNPVVIDCGSNIGLSLIYFKRQFPNADVTGFEPDDKIFGLLEQNVNSFGFKNVALNKAAIWNEDTQLNFFSDGSLAGSLEIDLANKNVSNSVKAVRLKSLLQNKKIDFLKIDIEGAESTVMFDIKEELKNVKFFFLEYHSILGKEQKFGEILEIIKSAGFRYYIKNHNDYLTHPFNEKAREGFDMQLSIFCYRD
ncbi:MAG: FkbM family methyltransferase [Chitinophagaceae bacterium]